MEIMTRSQFSEYFNNLEPRFNTTSKDSPLWIPETDYLPSSHFIQLSQLGLKGKLKKDFWKWCNQTLFGQVRCYSSGDDGEWWGFTDLNDIPIFLLKWS